MKLSKPSDKVLHEYLLNMGEEWVKEVYGMIGDEIDNILYGGVLPTEDRQKKKIEKARKQDEAKGAYLKNFRDDHFIWDDPSKNHIRCQNAEEKPKVIPDEDFFDKLIDLYVSLMKSDMTYNNNGMKNYGWSLGERVINKTTSLTTDDNIHEKILRYLTTGKMDGYIYAKMAIKHDHKKNRSSSFEDENFLDNTESMNISDIETYNNNKKHISVYDM